MSTFPSAGWPSPTWHKSFPVPPVTKLLRPFVGVYTCQETRGIKMFHVNAATWRVGRAWWCGHRGSVVSPRGYERTPPGRWVLHFFPTIFLAFPTCNTFKAEKWKEQPRRKTRTKMTEKQAETRWTPLTDNFTLVVVTEWEATRQQPNSPNTWTHFAPHSSWVALRPRSCRRRPTTDARPVTFSFSSWVAHTSVGHCSLHPSPEWQLLRSIDVNRQEKNTRRRSGFTAGSSSIFVANHVFCQIGRRSSPLLPDIIGQPQFSRRDDV